MFGKIHSILISTATFVEYLFLWQNSKHFDVRRKICRIKAHKIVIISRNFYEKLKSRIWQKQGEIWKLGSLNMRRICLPPR